MSSRRLVSVLFWVLFALLVVAPIGAWSALALWFRLPAPDSVRWTVAGLVGAIAFVTILASFTRRRWVGLAIFALVFAATVVWWGTITPPADGDWAPDVARQTAGTVDGDILTLSDVRDFEWRTEEDFTPRWGARSYDLSKLEGVDMFLGYWTGPLIAHPMFSFVFKDGEKLTWSVEVRRENGGVYSPLADAFRSSTLISLATTERDTIRLRSNIRREDVRLFRLRVSPAQARAFLLGYVAEANALKQSPAFYNTVTTNCTTAVARMIWNIGGNLPLDWRLLLNGFLPSYLYDHGFVTTAIPLDELIARADIVPRALQADQSPDFSTIIREGVPSPFGDAAR